MSGGMKITGGGHPEAGGIVRIIKEHPIAAATTGLSLGALACAFQGLTTPAAPTEVITYSPTPFIGTPSATVEAPGLPINESVSKALGEEYNDLTESIGANGVIKGLDRENVLDFNARVDFDTVLAKETPDWHYKNIVTADATDSEGKKIRVAWNPDRNGWVKVPDLNTDPAANIDSSFNLFYDIDKAIESGDMDIIILAQNKVDNTKPFMPGSPTPQIWLNTGKLDTHYYQYLSFFPDNKHTNSGWMSETFVPDNLPFQTVAYIRGMTSDGKWYVSTPSIINGGKIGNVIEYFGVDYVSYTTMGVNAPIILTNEYDSMFGVPVFPFPSDMADWVPNSTIYGIHVPGIIEPDLAARQQPGALFNLLPTEIQQELREDLPAGGKKSIMLSDGMTPEIAKLVSRNLLFRGFDKIEF